MTEIWSDPVAKMRMEMFRALTTRMLVETDPAKLRELIEELTRIVEGERQRPPAN